MNILQRPKKTKVIIAVESGLITSVFANKEIEVFVIDHDCEGYYVDMLDYDELVTADEVNKFVEDSSFLPINFKSGIIEEENLNIKIIKRKECDIT